MPQTKVPKTKMINRQKYVLWDTQYTEDNAMAAAAIVRSHVPWCKPAIVKSKTPHKEQYRYYIYVKENP